jgi:DNA-binding transcriptional ArsR family regulator
MPLEDEQAQPPREDPEQARAGGEPGQQVEPRALTDARTMRALSHPVRISIMEALGLGGPMTATEVGEVIDESPTTCSFHLRQLAKYGFVEEAGGGKGRARPWRVVNLGFSIPATHDDPEVNVAANVLTRVTRERQLARYQNWVDTRASYPRDWQDGAISSEYVFYLTAGELKQLDTEMQELLRRWFGDGGRITDPAQRPPGSVAVEVLTLGYPLELPRPAAGDEPGSEGDA